MSIAGYSSPYLSTTITTTDVQKGRAYRFRYRAQNCHGWGPFSPLLFAIAASPPASPSALQVQAISSTSISLQLYPTLDNGGTVVTDYLIYRNDGLDGFVWTQMTSYAYSTSGFLAVIDAATEALTPGRFY